MFRVILGISAYYHDSAACIIINGKLIAAAQEERFTRKKHDSSFPTNAIKYVLEEGNCEISDIDAVIYYEKPFLKFERLLETYHSFAPRGLFNFLKAMPVWLKEKLFIKKIIRDNLRKDGAFRAQIIFAEHHLSHAASAFFPSPFEEAAIVTLDGTGEYATATIGLGKGNSISILKELSFPHSIGLLYSAFTYYLGFKVNSGEYKLMGLAPYGNHSSTQVKEFVDIIKKNFVKINPDGSILLNMKYFKFCTGFVMTNNNRWTKLFSVPPRKPESAIKQEHMDLALAIQIVTEEIVLKIAKTARDLTNCKNIVLSGGVALNSVANGKLMKTGMFKNMWIQPASGDAGGALGAAYAAWYIWKNNERVIDSGKDKMQGAYIGKSYSDDKILNFLESNYCHFTHYKDFEELSKIIAKKIADGKVVGWFQGRMEFGPRALGNRSILGDARNPEMQKKMNLKIKFRESFRPFAPSVLEEDLRQYFDIDVSSPYMLLVIPVNQAIRNKLPEDYENLNLNEKLYFNRSIFPSITHIDYSARIQSVNKEDNYRYWRLISDFKAITNHGIIINTSFNVRGEPIVCSPADAYKCFMHTELDYLVLGNYLLDKKEQIYNMMPKHSVPEFVND